MNGLDPKALRYDADGLVPVVAQEAVTGEVLMLAWADREALDLSLSRGGMHYWSRSRQRLWEKGEESGHRQAVVRLAPDCDGDAVLALVRQKGAACHRDTSTCFDGTGAGAPRPTLLALTDVIEDRRARGLPGSYTSRLLADAKLASKKIGEESAELVAALASEPAQRVAEEAADLLYHLLVACAGRGVRLRSILEVLEGRRR